MRTSHSKLSIARLAVAAVFGVSCLLALSGGATAQDLEGQLDEKQQELSEQRDREEVLTDEIAEYSEQISVLEGQIAVLQQREAVVIEDLRETKLELKAARERLQKLRHRLEDSIEVLEERLIAIYKQGEPDALTVILQADGFDDLVERYEYLKTIQDQDNEIVGRVRDLRSDQAGLVEQIEAAKARLEAKRRELIRTRAEVESREAELEGARASRQGVLDRVESTIQRLEGDVSEIQDDIEAQLSESSSTTNGTPPAANPDSSVSSQGLIWPVDGVLTSPFGWRWGRMHEGIDIGLGAGNPIVASASGTVSLAAPYGGYGNYTCIDHGGGLSTCYAHQSVQYVSSGQSVSQGETIGLVGCTGSCFGDHLHYEVRINGAAVDPLGYL